MPLYRSGFRVDDQRHDVLFEAVDQDDAKQNGKQIILKKFPAAQIDDPPVWLELPYFTGGGRKIIPT